jgi:tetratricopeptide (TPR) repeat protein
MLFKLEEGNLKIKEGEFEASRNIFSNLLDEDPENVIYQSGYFISRYWDNRIDSILSPPEGKLRANQLVIFFREFDSEIKTRNYPKNESYEAAVFCVLTEASQHYRISYQKEGMLGFDKEILKNLSMCLVRIGDYKNALEVIEYSRKFMEDSIKQIFYRAECLYHLGDLKGSVIHFRIGFIQSPEELELDIVKSEPLTTAIKELRDRFPDEDDLKEFLPVYCLEKNYFKEGKEYSRDEVQWLISEMERLEGALQRENENLKFKLESRILHIGLTILDSFQAQINPDISKRVRAKIIEVDKGILERRNMTRKNAEPQTDEEDY